MKFCGLSARRLERVETMAIYLVSETQLVLVHWTVEADSEDEARERFMTDHETLTEISRDVIDSQGLTITPRRD